MILCRLSRPLGSSFLIRGLAALAVGLGLGLMAGPTRAAAPPAQADASREVLVLLRLPPDHFRPGGNYADSYGDGAGAAARKRVAQKIAAAHGLTVVTNWPIPLAGVDCFVMTVPAGQTPEQVAQVLARDPEVAGAEPMHVFRAQASTQGAVSGPR